MKRTWPDVKDKTLDAIYTALRYVIRTRDEDLSDWDNLPQTYVMGRKVGKIPTGSADIVGSQPGDFNFDGSYFYYCVFNTVTNATVWRRISSGSW